MSLPPVRRAKAAHEAVKTALPVVAALVTIGGAAIAAWENKELQHGEAEAQEEGQQEKAGSRKVIHPWRSILGTLLTFGGYAVTVVAGTAIVIGLVYLYLIGNETGRAVEMVILLFAALWLANVKYERTR